MASGISIQIICENKSPFSDFIKVFHEFTGKNVAVERYKNKQTFYTATLANLKDSLCAVSLEDHKCRNRLVQYDEFRAVQKQIRKELKRDLQIHWEANKIVHLKEQREHYPIVMYELSTTSESGSESENAKNERKFKKRIIRR